MFLYPYPHTVHFTEGHNWSQQQQENRVSFPSEIHNTRSTQNGKNQNGLLELGTPSMPSMGHQTQIPISDSVSILPGTLLPPHHFQHLESSPEQKPLIGEYADIVSSIGAYNIKEKCRTCGEELLQADLIQHMRNHMGPRRCEICNYEAPTKHHLREHLNTHTGLKPYKCQFCDKSFAAKNSLRVHTMYLHTKVRAHQCHFCDQRFVTTSERKSHELVHTDKCPICQMSFRLRGHLRQHMKSHANAAFHHKKR